MKTKDFFTATEQNQILQAIREAEAKTSGEIRVHVNASCKGDPLDEAAFWFAKLKMHKTEQRNGVLFFLVPGQRKFAILGDQGINRVVPEGFWDGVKDLMQKHFREGQFATGLTEGIKLAGEQLKTHFPCKKDDVNELSDTISFDKG